MVSILYLPTYAQIGIGTVSPDSSSILDITSTKQVLLAPRMTIIQRNAIDTPAEGLLVFDIDLNAFFYYDINSFTWKEILTDTIRRDNYVLVKSEADFPLAVSGTISLDENVLYEINGNIIITNSINLNNATIIGHDIGEDIISKATGTIFVGDKGGN